MNFNRLEENTDLAPVDWAGIASIEELYALASHERTLGDYWRILRRRKWAILVSLIIVVTTTALISLRMTPVYDAVARISISAQNPGMLKFKDDQQFENQRRFDLTLPNRKH